MEKERLEIWEVVTLDNVDVLLNNVDELLPDEEIGFHFMQEGKLVCAALGKSDYEGFDCAYYLTVEKDTDLFDNKDELSVFLKHLLKFG